MNNRIFNKFSIFMSFLFIFMAVSIPVFATTPTLGENHPTEGSVTINKNGSTFTAYEVLSATQSGDAYEYTPTNEFKKFFNNPNYTMNSKDTTSVYTVDNLQKLTTDQVKDLATNIHKYVLDNSIKGISLLNGQKTTVNLGYYLVTETSKDSSDAMVASTPILVSVPQVLNKTWNYNLTINPKDNKPTLEKNIIENGKKVKTSSANIGDVIKYEVNSVIPAYQSNATGIKYIFTDTMSKGLTYDENTGFNITSGDKTFVNGTDYNVSTTKDSTGKTIITIEFKYDNIKEYATKGLTLHYQATLNENALISTKDNGGNPNDIDLEYTNNPYVKDSYKHLKDHVTTYTWGFAIKKVDSDDTNKTLQGAEFALTPSKKNVITDSNGIASFKGLKEGTYYIKELSSPKGYSLLKDPIEVTITPKKDSTGNYTGSAIINISNNNKAGYILNNPYETNGNDLFTVQITNHAGFSIPRTGGVGTIGFVKIAITLLSLVCVLGMLGLLYLKLENKKASKN